MSGLNSVLTLSGLAELTRAELQDRVERIEVVEDKVLAEQKEMLLCVHSCSDSPGDAMTFGQRAAFFSNG